MGGDTQKNKTSPNRLYKSSNYSVLSKAPTDWTKIAIKRNVLGPRIRWAREYG